MTGPGKTAERDGEQATVYLGTVEDTADARPAERSVDRIALRQEGWRGIIALVILLLFGITLVWALDSTSNWTEMKELLDVWLPALTALLGSAVGFYFGVRQ